MNPLIFGPLLEFAQNLIGRWFPDPEKKAAAELELFKLAQAGDLQKVMGQLEINAKEAQSSSIFVAGWRPFSGWIGGVGLLYASVGQPLLVWYATMHSLPPPPAIDSDTLMYVLGGMLGLGTLRTYEKKVGVTK